MNSFIGLVFFHDLCICAMDSLHCIALYFVFRLYDSALAIILLKAT